MKKGFLKSIIVSTALISSLPVAFTTNNYQVNAARSYKAYTGSKSITYKDRSGKMTITGVDALHMKNSD